jgi:hypothetical protein
MYVRFLELLRPAAFSILVALFTVPALAQSNLSSVDPSVTQTLEPQAQAATPQPVSPADRSVSGLLHEIGHDFLAFPRRDNLMWLGVGAGLSLAAHRADGNLTKSFSSSHEVEEALEPGRTVGGAMVQFGSAVTTYAIGRLTKKPEVTHLGSDLIRAQVLTQGITQGIKFAVQRTRPDGTSNSFPSGHTAAAFATATVLRNHYGWRAGVPAYAIASYVAASRLSENRHYASDLVFGATVGILSARTVTIGHGSFRFAVTPFATPGGAGIALTKTSRESK